MKNERLAHYTAHLQGTESPTLNYALFYDGLPDTDQEVYEQSETTMQENKIYTLTQSITQPLSRLVREHPTIAFMASTATIAIASELTHHMRKPKVPQTTPSSV